MKVFIIIKKVLLATITSILLILNSCNTTEPETIDYHNKILFTSSRSGEAQLYLMNPDGTNIKQITSDNYSHGYGRWSPDAQKIVCNTEEGSTTAGTSMVVMNSNGSNRILFSYGNNMCWSPDGKEIVFSFNPRAELGDRTTNIYIINYKNYQYIQLTNNSGNIDSNPCFSPDGNSIAYSSNRDFSEEPAKSEIYVMNNKGKNSRRLTYLNSESTLNPSWSNDGSIIFFNSVGKIYSVDLNENIVRTICSSDEYVFVEPRISYKENKMIFIARLTDGSERSYIYMANIDGTNLHMVIDDDSVTSCDWSK